MLYLFASNIEAKKIKGSILYTCWEGRERVRERERERNSTKYYSHTYNYHLLLDLLQLLKSEELSHFQQSQRNGGAKILACLPAVAKIGDLLSRAS
jgi:hypothetical protein